MSQWTPPAVDPSCYPKGFRVAGISCGVKASGRRDLAAIVSDTTNHAAAVFTRSRFVSPSIVVSKRHGRNGLRAVIVSSGSANAGTGEQGERDALRMCEMTAGALGAATEEVHVCTTGVIGVPLSMEKIEQGVPRVAQALSPTAWEDAAEAICTTDAFRKMAGRRWSVGDREVRLIGIAKGAGMIHPDMATMLAFLATDARVESGLLESVLRHAVRDSFNSISVDGDTSTNDTVLLMANGHADNDPIAPGTDAAASFEEHVRQVCIELAQMVVRDGEGATKLVTLEVRGARSDEEARQAARTVANSILFKMAVLGEDPNWGRIVAALGNAGVELRPELCSIGFDGIAVLDRGRLAGADRQRLVAALKKDEFRVEIDLGTGGAGQATFWTCDISEAYMKFNARYTT